MAEGLSYTLLVYAHLLLFVFWLGASVGLLVLGHQFRQQSTYSRDQRVAMLKLGVVMDLTRRIAWALMVPSSLTLSDVGGWWEVPDPLVRASWFVGAVWIWLVLDSHKHDMTPRAARNKRWEGWLRWILCAFYVALGAASIATGEPIGQQWLAAKALLFGLILASAIMVDLAFKPAGGLLETIVAEGLCERDEEILLQSMNRARIATWCVFGLILAAAWLGLSGPRGVSGLT